LERERAEARDFIPKLERLLVAVDTSSNGRLASRISGLLAGARRVMTTVLELTLPDASPDRTPVTDIVKESTKAASARAGQQSTADTTLYPPQVRTGQAKQGAVADVILAEAGKGYDMVVLGIEHALNPSHPGTSSSDVERIFEGFLNPIALAVSRSKDLSGTPDNLTRILVPATGTDYSRLAAEIAIAVAKASKSTVTALSVSRSPASFDLLRSRRERYLSTARAAARDIQEIGNREGVKVRPLAVRGRDHDATILQQIKKGNYDLVVIGVKTRPLEGEGLFFGESAAALLEGSPATLLIVRS